MSSGRKEYNFKRTLKYDSKWLDSKYFPFSATSFDCFIFFFLFIRGKLHPLDGRRQEAVAMSFTYLQLLHYYIKNTFETVNVANWYAALRSVVAGANKARNVSSPMDISKARNSTMCRIYKCTADDNGI